MESADTAISGHKLRALYALATLLAVVMLSYHTQITISYLQRAASRDSAIGSPWSYYYGTMRIYEPYGPARDAALERGDLLTNVNGIEVRSYHDVSRALMRFSGGDTVRGTVLAASDGQPRDFSLVLPSAESPGFSGILLEAVMQRFMPWVCILLGLWVIFARPWDYRAWLLTGLLLAFSGVMLRNEGLSQIASWPHALRAGIVLFHNVLTGSWPIWMLLFGLSFPKPFAWMRRGWPIVAVGSAAVLFGVTWSALRTTQAYAGLPLPTVAPPPGWFASLLFWLGNLYIGGFFASLGVRSATTADPDGKRRIRILYAGGSASLTPIFLLILYRYFTGHDFTTLPAVVWVPGLMLTCVFPLVLAYVILVERAMDVRMAIRRGIQYALARGLLLLLRFVLIVAVIVYSVRITSDPWGNLPQFVMVISATVLTIIGIRMGSEKVQTWVDRRFFREAYNTELVLTALGERVLHLSSRDEILQSVCETASDTLHVPAVAAFVQQDGDYRCAFATASAAELRGIALPLQAIPFGGNQDNQAASSIRIPPPGASRRPGATAREDILRQFPEAKGYDLLAPISGREGILGFLLFGKKRSDAPYSLADQSLLELVARQTGLAIENSKLADDVAHQIAARELLQREIGIAREIQQRLLPSRFPQFAGFELAGFCEPAQSVGGDYFDFIPLDDGRIAIAVGDVAGKGIPAALLMASVQASLRGLLAGGVSDVAETMTRLNRLVYEATPANRFVTLFFGILSSDGGLSYVSAGHCTSLIAGGRNGTGREISPLEGRGPALGLLRNSSYTAKQATLRKGAVLVAYTDGVLEAMNSSRDEFGESRLLAALRNGTAPGGTAATEAIRKAVDAFTNGAAPHDDLTVIAVGRAANQVVSVKDNESYHDRRDRL